MGYAKLFSSITESSLWSQSKDARILFVSMLARADATGFVEASLPGLARLSNLTESETAEALRVLMSNDPFSKDLLDSPENMGKRLLQVPRGWMIINYEHYRNERDDDKRRAYMRNYMSEYRAKLRGETCKLTVNNGKHSVNTGKQLLATVSSRKPALAQAEAEAEAEADTIRSVRARATPANPKSPSLAQVKLAAAKIGMPDWLAEEFFRTYETSEWKIRGEQIRAWRATLGVWQTRWVSNGRPGPEKRMAGHFCANAGHPGNGADFKFTTLEENERINEEFRKRREEEKSIGNEPGNDTPK